jgi:flagellar L-ring protein precursor FlgH
MRIAPALATFAPALVLALASSAAPLAAQARRDSVVVAPTAPPAALGARAGRQSWTSDRRAFAVGDLVIVRLEENTVASATSRDDATNDRSADFGFQLVTPGATAATAPGASFEADKRAQSRNRGDRSRQLRLQGEITARVMAIDPVTGVLQLKGTKTVGVDKDQQLITFAGSVRPQDLTGTNMVASSRVADARLDIVNKGSLGKAKQGIVGRVLGAFWP